MKIADLIHVTDHEGTVHDRHHHRPARRHLRRLPRLLATVVTARLLICCDGTPADRPGMTLERCRAFIPSRSPSRFGARRQAFEAGWSWAEGRDLCPACTRAVTS
jgi:hypothetical protein